jgi:site-specific DNA-methyltransferase (adenine-specific)
LKLLKASKQNNDDDIVVVPFAGSGSECVACKQLQLPFIGFEINPEYVNICNERLNDVDASAIASISFVEAVDETVESISYS